MTGMTALLLFAAWTLVLVMTHAGYRVLMVLSMKKKANAWTRGLPNDDPGFVTRTGHAHLNCVENLPVYGAIVLAAWALGKSPVVDSVAALFLALRLAQSITHLIGVSHWLVFIRANFFILQVLLCFWMIWGLLN